MSRKQWGHGFHAGRRSKERRGYVGMWFFTVRDGGEEIEYQGEIRRKVGKEQYGVQRHSWLDGCASGAIVVVEQAEVERWHLFPTAQDLRRGIHEYRLRHRHLYPEVREGDIEVQERFLRAMNWPGAGQAE